MSTDELGDFIEERRRAARERDLAASRPISTEPEDPDLDPMRLALERTLANFKTLLANKPVRDATETIAEAEAALRAALATQSRGLDVDRLARAIRAAKAEYPGLFVDWAAASEHTCRAIAAEYARLAKEPTDER